MTPATAPAPAPKPCACDACRNGIGTAEAKLSRSCYGAALCQDCRERANAHRWQQILSRHAAGLEPFQPVAAKPSGYGLWGVTVKAPTGETAWGGGWSVAQAMANAQANAKNGHFSEAAA